MAKKMKMYTQILAFNLVFYKKLNPEELDS